MVTDLDRIAKTALDGTFQSALIASRQLRTLVKDEGKRRRLLTYDHVLRAIVAIGKHENDDVQRDLSIALHSISKAAPDGFERFASEFNGFSVIAALLRASDQQCLLYAARTVTNIASVTSLIHLLIAQGCVLPLVGILKSVRLAVKIRVAGIRALGSLCHGPVAVRMLTIWAVPPALELVTKIGSCDDDGNEYVTNARSLDTVSFDGSRQLNSSTFAGHMSGVILDDEWKGLRSLPESTTTSALPSRPQSANPVIRVTRDSKDSRYSSLNLDDLRLSPSPKRGFSESDFLSKIGSNRTSLFSSASPSRNGMNGTATTGATNSGVSSAIRSQICESFVLWCSNERMVSTMLDTYKDVGRVLLSVSVADPDVIVRRQALSACREITCFKKGVRCVLSGVAEHVSLMKQALLQVPADSDFDVRHAFVIMLEHCLELRPSSLSDVVSGETFFDIEKIILSNMSISLALAVLRSSSNTPMLSRIVVGSLAERWSELCIHAHPFERNNIVSGLLSALRNAANSGTKLNVVKSLERMLTVDPEFATRTVKLEGFQILLSMLNARVSPATRVTSARCLMHLSLFMSLDNLAAGSLSPMASLLEEAHKNYSTKPAPGLGVVGARGTSTSSLLSVISASGSRGKKTMHTPGSSFDTAESDSTEPSPRGNLAKDVSRYTSLNGSLTANGENDDISVATPAFWHTCICVTLETFLRLSKLGADMRTRILSRGVLPYVIQLSKTQDLALLLLGVFIEDKLALSSFDSASIVQVLADRFATGQIPSGVALPFVRTLGYVGDVAENLLVKIFTADWTAFSFMTAAAETPKSAMTPSAELSSPSHQQSSVSSSYNPTKTLSRAFSVFSRKREEAVAIPEPPVTTSPSSNAPNWSLCMQNAASAFTMIQFRRDLFRALQPLADKPQFITQCGSIAVQWFFQLGDAALAHLCIPVIAYAKTNPEFASTITTVAKNLSLESLESALRQKIISNGGSPKTRPRSAVSPSRRTIVEDDLDAASPVKQRPASAIPRRPSSAASFRPSSATGDGRKLYQPPSKLFSPAPRPGASTPHTRNRPSSAVSFAPHSEIAASPSFSPSHSVVATKRPDSGLSSRPPSAMSRPASAASSRPVSTARNRSIWR
eukprot:ANDGO_00579.mRNA.1 hypothetical protein